MLAYVLPLLIVILSNTVYQICAKSLPEDLDPFASLTVTYLVSAVISLALYYALNRGGSFMQELRKLNWVPFAFGIVLIGLEAGFIYAYKAGWKVSTLSIVQSAFLAVILLILGFVLYKEPLTRNKLAGVAICLVGLYVINR